jgi:undecaprenyl-diphosphatase
VSGERTPGPTAAPGSPPGPRPGGVGLSPRLALALLVALPAAVLVGFLVLAVESSWGPLRELDVSVADALHGQALGHPAWVRALILVSDIGSPTVLRIAAAALALLLLLRGARRLSLWVAATMAGGAAIDEALKVLVDRARPVFAHPVATAPGPAFPSGHAFTATLGAGVFLLTLLPLLSRRARAGAWLLAALVPIAVGYSRIALGVHWTSDVLGGWLLGVGLLTATTAAFETWRREHALPGVRPTVEGVAPEESAHAAHDAGDDRPSA